MRCVSAGLEALPGHAQRPCHRWSTAASVQASAAHRRAPPVRAAHGSPMPKSYPSRCRCSAKLGEQYDCCAACQLVWRRCWAMRGFSAIGGAPQQACWLQLRIDVHHLSELLTALDAQVVPE